MSPATSSIMGFIPVAQAGVGPALNCTNHQTGAVQHVPTARAAQMIIDQSNSAFVAGTVHAMMISAIIIVAASILTVLILPDKVRPPQEEKQVAPKGGFDHTAA